jgi:NTE family protein
VTRLRQFGALVLLLVAAACSYPVRNEAIPAGKHDEYKWVSLPADDDTLIVVTASGGGTRAATLAMSVLQAMDQMRDASGGSLANRIDVVSSVSGGSVTAGYFALRGVDGLPALESRFLTRDGMAPLIAGVLNPVGLAMLSTPSKERIDLLIDYFDRQLFAGATFHDLVRRNRRPYLILNAADMVEGTPFPFTQYTMDLLCSDLTSMKLATAVAASAAFPVALSPVTLKNYRPCTTKPRPGWIEQAQKTSWYSNPPRVAWGRTAEAYATGRKAYVHLLDGGIADNLGVAEPYRLLTTDDVTPNFKSEISRGRVKKIVFVMVNARSFQTSRLDTSQATPGMLDMALASVSASIDRATFSAAERIRGLLIRDLEAAADQLQQLAPTSAAHFREAARNTFFLTVDFDAIDNPDCRRKFHGIGTNWSLGRAEINALKAVGGALLMKNDQNDGAVGKMLQAVGAEVRGPIATMDQACALVPELEE